MMKKDQLSYADVEQLLTELAQHDQSTTALDEAQTELMRSAARGEIRRVFRRRRCLRLAREMAAVTALGSTLYLLYPEVGSEAALAEGKSGVPQAAAPAPSAAVALSPVLHTKKKAPAAPSPGISYESHTAGCELVIYSVPL